MLLLHGWPGSVWEFHSVVQRLRGKYHFVVPSLPGYGWSEGAREAGLCPVEAAHILAQLMQRLGYRQYYVQGGDWGSMVAQGILIYVAICTSIAGTGAAWLLKALHVCLPYMMFRG